MNDKTRFWILLGLLVLSIGLFYLANTALNHNVLIGR